MIVYLNHGTGGDAVDRDVIKDGLGRPCLCVLIFVFHEKYD